MLHLGVLYVCYVRILLLYGFLTVKNERRRRGLRQIYIYTHTEAGSVVKDDIHCSCVCSRRSALAVFTRQGIALGLLEQIVLQVEAEGRVEEPVMMLVPNAVGHVGVIDRLDVLEGLPMRGSDAAHHGVLLERVGEPRPIFARVVGHKTEIQMQKVVEVLVDIRSAGDGLKRASGYRVVVVVVVAHVDRAGHLDKALRFENGVRGSEPDCLPVGQTKGRRAFGGADGVLEWLKLLGNVCPYLSPHFLVGGGYRVLLSRRRARHVCVLCVFSGMRVDFIPMRICALFWEAVEE